MELLQQPEFFIDRLKIRVVQTWWQLSNLMIEVIAHILFTPARKPRNILVFRTGSIGDSICAMPAISSLRDHFQDARIELLTNAGKGRRNLVSIEALLEPGICDHIINYEELSLKSLILLLRKNRYDLIIHLTQYDTSLARLVRDMAFFRIIGGVRSGFGWQYSGITLFKRTQEKYLRHTAERDRLLQVLRKSGIPAVSDNRYLFHITHDDRMKIKQLVGALNLSGRPVLGIVPGAKREQNRWPLASFETIVRHFSREFDIFLIGGPDDISLAQPLLNIPNTYSFCGLLSPVQSGLLMKYCRLVLSNDTGPMHLAYAFGTPVIALFSNRDFPQRWFPPENGGNAVLRSSDVSCSICFSETCQDNICMKKIHPAVVIERMNSMLSNITSCVA